jgi:hypothetical protein
MFYYAVPVCYEVSLGLIDVFFSFQQAYLPTDNRASLWNEPRKSE